jgi:hypothetical protein
MHVRTTTRKSKDGSTVCYLHLARNEWDAATGTSPAQRAILAKLGIAEPKRIITLEPGTPA